MLQRLEFGASYVYAPRGQSQLSQTAKRYVGALKRGDSHLLPQFVQRIVLHAQQGEFPNFFGPAVTLIPVPGSAPLVKGGLWVPLLLANAFRDSGLARDVAPVISRIAPVRKSAFAAAADRPNVQQHYDSLTVQVVKPAPTHIVLIDDVVTQGCTFLAAASRLAEAYPDAEIRGFAIVRTMSRAGVEVDQIVAPRTGTISSPCVGTIEARRDRAVRRP